MQDVAPFIQYQRRFVYIVDAAPALGLPNQANGKARHLIIFACGMNLAGIPCEHVAGFLEFRDCELRNGWLYGQGRRRFVIDLDQVIQGHQVSQALAEHLAQVY